MTKRVIVICEGKSDYTYLRTLQRFVENDLPLPQGAEDAPLRFVPRPSDDTGENPGVGTGYFDQVAQAYRAEEALSDGEEISVWVDADIYIRNEIHAGRKGNGDLYRERSEDIPVFKFSYHNFEDFLALHCDEATFQTWKTQVLFSSETAGEALHHERPLPRKAYLPRFQKVLPLYSKHKMPFDFSLEHLSNLRRHLKDPDVQAMAERFQPGISFGTFLLALFDEAYPGMIP